MDKLKYIQIAVAIFFLVLLSCKGSVKEENEGEARKTPVEIEGLRSVSMDEIIEFPAISVYLKKETVRSSLQDLYLK